MSLGEPSTCNVWQGEVKLFSGSDHSASLHECSDSQPVVKRVQDEYGFRYGDDEHWANPAGYQWTRQNIVFMSRRYGVGDCVFLRRTRTVFADRVGVTEEVDLRND